MTRRMLCANMAPMGELRDRLLEEITVEAGDLVAAEEAVAKHRERLHTLIRVAGSEHVEKDERSGPSALARATGHRYTREYIGTLLKTAVDESVVKRIDSETLSSQAMRDISEAERERRAAEA